MLLFYFLVLTLPLMRVYEMIQCPFAEYVILTLACYLTMSQNRVTYFPGEMNHCDFPH